MNTQKKGEREYGKEKGQKRKKEKKKNAAVAKRPLTAEKREGRNFSVRLSAVKQYSKAL